jgi:probable rRNA maturation factor
VRPTSEPEGPEGIAVYVDGLDRPDAAYDLSGPEDPDPAALAARVEAVAVATLVAQERTSPAGAELSVTFITDGEISRLNREWLDRDGPTDVIAFGLGTAPLVGDIYISLDAARRQAGERGLRVDEELLRLTVHGVLHVAGYDHPEGDERHDSPMYLLQERVLTRLLEDGPGG